LLIREVAVPTPRRRGRPWQRLQAKLKSDPRNHCCWKCGRWIDTKLHHNHPMSWTLDHLIPLVHDGAELDERNVRPAHRRCNSSAGAKLRRNPGATVATRVRRLTRPLLPADIGGQGRGRGSARKPQQPERSAATVPSLPPAEIAGPQEGLSASQPGDHEAVVVGSAPDGLGPRGARLWALMSGQVKGDAAALVLLEEAARLADRLDRLDRILSGADEGWMRVAANRDGDEVTVYVDKVLSEARQQQLALKGVLAELRQRAAPTASRPVTSATAMGEAGVSDSLRARVAAAWGTPPAG
jgi:hypothetical protein